MCRHILFYSKWVTEVVGFLYVSRKICKECGTIIEEYEFVPRWR